MKRSLLLAGVLFAALLFGCDISVPDESGNVTGTIPAVSETAAASSSAAVFETETGTASAASFSSQTETVTAPHIDVPFDYFSLPEYTGSPYCEVNENHPYFEDSDLNDVSYEFYSPLDALGRCGECTACIGRDLMPTDSRGEIGSVRPTGFHIVRYDDIIADKYLYNRCHLIGWQLTGENANERNLITGTRYMNVEGMLPFENRVAGYIRKTGDHVLYRVTPVFIEDELVCRGVLMEARSVGDNGAGVCFNVFCYNVQPKISIDYSDGESHRLVEAETSTASVTEIQTEAVKTSLASSAPDTYILNTNTHRFHFPSCQSAKSIKEKNRLEYSGTREEIIAQGYAPCSQCKP